MSPLRWPGQPYIRTGGTGSDGIRPKAAQPEHVCAVLGISQASSEDDAILAAQRKQAEEIETVVIVSPLPLAEREVPKALHKCLPVRTIAGE